MLRQLTTLLLTTTLGLASAAPAIAPAIMARKLIIGTPYQILTADFDGTSFSLTGSGNKTVGSAPSWLIFKDPNRLYAVNENADDLNLFTLDAASSNPTFASTAVGSSGVVFLEFNADQSRMVGAAYGSGMVDVWDTTATDGSLKLLKQVNVTGPLGPNQEVHHPHQALLDPTGRFFVIPDLGGDAIFVLDGKDDRYEITGNVTLEAGAGPRHGGFITSGDLTFYVIACEISNQVILYQLHYAEDTIKFTEVQKQSTYGPGFPPANATSAAVGELAVASNNKDVYISNRLSGNETDSIAHFTFNSGGTNGSATLHFADTTSSGGLLPRMFSLSMDADESLVFVANQGGDNGLAAFKRCPKSGSLSSTPVATLPSASLVAPELAATPNMGPQFVKELC